MLLPGLKSSLGVVLQMENEKKAFQRGLLCSHLQHVCVVYKHVEAFRKFTQKHSNLQ